MPRLTCLMTPTGSLPRVKSAIDAYCRQTYDGADLVVAPARNGRYLQSIERYVATLDRPDVRVVWTGGSSAAESVERIAGTAADDLVCLWSEDQLSHPARLEVHAGWHVRCAASWSVVADPIVCNASERLVYWLDAGDPWPAHAFGTYETVMTSPADLPAVLERAHAAPARIPPESRLPLEGGPVTARVVGRSLGPDVVADETRLSEVCHDEATYRSCLGTLQAALPAYSLPRPFLLRTRSTDGEMTTMEVDL